MNKILHKNLSYQIIGLLFDVYNELGYGYQEKYYGRAFEKLLIVNNVKYEKELSCLLTIQQQSIGRYRLDFLIENKIVIELKVAKQFYPRHIK